LWYTFFAYLLVVIIKKSMDGNLETVLGLFGGDGGRRQTIADDDGALVDLRSGSGPWGYLHVSRCVDNLG